MSLETIETIFSVQTILVNGRPIVHTQTIAVCESCGKEFQGPYGLLVASYHHGDLICGRKPMVISAVFGDDPSKQRFILKPEDQITSLSSD